MERSRIDHVRRCRRSAAGVGGGPGRGGGDAARAGGQTQPGGAADLAPQPWVNQPHGEWPAIALENKAWFKNKRRVQGATAFFFEVPDGRVFAGTARHILGREEVTLQNFDEQIASWIVSPKKRTSPVISLGKLAISPEGEEGHDWLVLKPKSDPRGKPSVRVLKARQEPVQVGEVVHLVGAPYSEPEARQNVYSGLVQQRSERGDFVFGLDPPVQTYGLSGAPILDERGYLVGVYQGHIGEDAQKRSDKAVGCDVAVALRLLLPEAPGTNSPDPDAAP